MRRVKAWSRKVSSRVRKGSGEEDREEEVGEEEYECAEEVGVAEGAIVRALVTLQQPRDPCTPYAPRVPGTMLFSEARAWGSRGGVVWRTEEPCGGMRVQRVSVVDHFPMCMHRMGHYALCGSFGSSALTVFDCGLRRLVSVSQGPPKTGPRVYTLGIAVVGDVVLSAHADTSCTFTWRRIVKNPLQLSRESRESTRVGPRDVLAYEREVCVYSGEDECAGDMMSPWRPVGALPQGQHARVLLKHPKHPIVYVGTLSGHVWALHVCTSVDAIDDEEARSEGQGAPDEEEGEEEGEEEEVMRGLRAHFEGAEGQLLRQPDRHRFCVVDVLGRKHEDMVRCMTWVDALDGVGQGWLATGSYDTHIHITRMRVGPGGSHAHHPVALLRGHKGWVSSLAARCSLLASGSHDKSVRLWCLRSFSCLRVLATYNSPVFAVHWFRSQLWAVSSRINKWRGFPWSRSMSQRIVTLLLCRQRGALDLRAIPLDMMRVIAGWVHCPPWPSH